MTRQEEYEKWLATYEWLPGTGRKYSAAVRSNYPRQLLYQISEEFEIPNVTSIFDILDIEVLKGMEKEYISGDLNKRQKDYRSAFRSYIEFCQHNEKTFDETPNAEDISDFLSKTEGKKKVVISVKSERDPSLRKAAIKHHGYTCKVCKINFKEKYGVWGESYIEVHHIRPLSSVTSGQVLTNPKTDLTVVCSNCHRMIHRKKGITLTVEELKKKIAEQTNTSR
jgi:predicted HNH restriction endonuclease